MFGNHVKHYNPLDPFVLSVMAFFMDTSRRVFSIPINVVVCRWWPASQMVFIAVIVAASQAPVLSSYLWSEESHCQLSLKSTYASLHGVSHIIKFTKCTLTQ